MMPQVLAFFDSIPSTLSWGLWFLVLLFSASGPKRNSSYWIAGFIEQDGSGNPAGIYFSRRSFSIQNLRYLIMIVSFLAENLETCSNPSVNLESITYSGLIHGQSKLWVSSKSAGPNAVIHGQFKLSVSSKSECGNICLFICSHGIMHNWFRSAEIPQSWFWIYACVI